MTTHVAVWLDHKEARVFHFHPGHADEATVLAPPHNDHHKHTRGQEGLKEHPEDTKRFFRGLADALQDADELLIAGPAAAKLQFFRFVQEFHHALETKVVGIETVDHPTDGQLVAFAKAYFDRVDGHPLSATPGGT